MRPLPIFHPFCRSWGRVAVLAAALGFWGGGCGFSKPADRADADAGADIHGEGGGTGGSGGLDGGATDGALSDVGTADGTIFVNTTNVDNADDGLCSLLEAIAAANTRASVNTNDCPAGVGNDVIILPAGTYAATAALEPAGDVEIRGAGTANTTIVMSKNARGCGVYVAAADRTVRVTNLTLTESGSTGTTGACAAAGTLWLRHVRVTNFSAGGLRAHAVGDAPAAITAFNTLVDNNHNPDNGGGIAFVGVGTRIYVEQSAIVNNTSDGLGGGVYGSGAGLNTLKYSTVSGNRAMRGGGVAISLADQGYMALYYSTIAFNHASDVGGGIFQQSPLGVTVNTILNNGIVTNNAADGAAAQSNLNVDWTSNVTCTNSLLYVAQLSRQPPNISDSCRYDVADAVLGPLMNMGGGDGLPIHALLPGSPAIDAIDPTNSAENAQQRDTWNSSAGDPAIGLGTDDVPPWSLFGKPLDGDGDGIVWEDMGPYEANPRWETELLALAGSPSSPHAVVTVPEGFSHGAGTRLAAVAIDNNVTYVLPVPQTGTFTVTTVVRAGGDSGRFQLSVADTAGGPYRAAGGVNDGYAAAPGGEWRSFVATEVTFTSVGQKYFRFTVTGKNDSSSGYQISPDFITVTKQ
jgi:hypothetical protein